MIWIWNEFKFYSKQTLFEEIMNSIQFEINLNPVEEYRKLE